MRQHEQSLATSAAMGRALTPTSPPHRCGVHGACLMHSWLVAVVSGILLVCRGQAIRATALGASVENLPVLPCRERSSWHSWRS